MIRTIIIDDEILSRIGIQSFLEGEENIEVVGVFESAQDALSFLLSNEVDIIITDIEMSGIDGLELITHVRKQELASGIIILSCHEDFHYAQDAISRGTDSYMLKMDITKESLVCEVEKVYEKTKHRNHMSKIQISTLDESKDYVYAVAILRTQLQKNAEAHLMEDNMVVHLLEEVVARYRMGTVFASYNRGIFIIFQFDHHLKGQKLKEELEQNLFVINGNVQQFINGLVLFGVSDFFDNLQETKEHYEEAVAAADLHFYEKDKTIYQWKEVSTQLAEIVFSGKDFLEENGMNVFGEELNAVCLQMQRKRAQVSRFRELLMQAETQFIYQILHEYSFNREFKENWKSDTRLLSKIMQASSLSLMKAEILDCMELFRRAVKRELDSDEFSEILNYIEKHLKERIILNDLADIGCMSIPSMCKKFKERTGLTIIQYANRKRIKKAKALMKRREYTLWQIAEETGFSNVNYLIRVFKKVTGMTVSEYRKQFDIIENMSINEMNIVKDK